MKFTRHAHVLAGRPQAIPFVNVAMLMLLFFIIAMRFTQEPGVSVQLPETTVNSPSFTGPQPPLIITITAPSANTQTSSIFFNDELVDLSRLEKRLTEAARQSLRRECIIKADYRVSYGLVVAVMAMAYKAEFKRVRLATQPPEWGVP